ncbi:MAG: chromosomal replication initiator protein DnaA [Candidatus Berkelbacteria bacterium]
MKTPDEKETWQAVLGELEVSLSKANFTTWFNNTFILNLSPENFIIGVPNSFAKEWLEKKYYPQILESLQKLHPQVKSFSCQVVSTQFKPEHLPLETKDSVSPVSFSAGREIPINITLNPKYTFDTFIVGGSNRLAAATAQAVAAKPGVTYNPLFLYGGVGLGKTHLAQAIGHEILAQNPKKKIIYVSCENFTNEFVQSISTGKVNDFKKKYRDADVLLVDDIQFLAGKEGTQEEFFHTFNALHQSNRQIVITSDRVPKAIPQLEARLSSRFGAGMVADVQPPNLEMRHAILRAKCEEKNYVVADEILNFIAENIESNIRELEGAITRVISYCELNKIEPTIEITGKVLEDMITAKSKNLSVEKIIKIVCEYFNIMPEHLLGARRSKELVGPRQITMYLLRHEMNMSFPKIGKELNKKDHTTIMHGVTRVEKDLSRHSELQKEVTQIKEKLYLN